MRELGSYGFARAFTRIEQEALNAVRHRHYDHPQPEGAPVNKIIASIEQELGQVSDEEHRILERHITTANMAAHVAEHVAELDANPLVSVVLNAGLGPQGSAALADMIRGVAGGLARLDPQAQAIPLPEPPLEPLPAPAADPAPEPDPAPAA